MKFAWFMGSLSLLSISTERKQESFTPSTEIVQMSKLLTFSLSIYSMKANRILYRYINRRSNILNKLTPPHLLNTSSDAHNATTPSQHLAMRALKKVPEVTIFFWIIKLLTTGMGETTSDFLVRQFDPMVAVVLGAIG